MKIKPTGLNCRNATWMSGLLGLSVLLPCLGGCVGSINDMAPESMRVPGTEPPSGPPGPGGVPGGIDPPPPVVVPPGVKDIVPAACAKSPVSPGPLALRRLTAAELANTIADLFPGQTVAPGDFKAEAYSNHGFDNDVINLTASPALVTPIANVASSVAAKQSADVGKLLGCPGVAAGDAERMCVEAFIKSFGERAYRRQIEAADVSEMAGLYTKLRAGGDTLQGSMQAVLQAMLQSADFLYRVEVSPLAVKDKIVPVGSWELASRLSYLLWGSMPDPELFAAAREGRLSTRADIEAQARRLLASPKARAVVARLHEGWLGLHKIDNVVKDPKTFPKFTPTVAALMQTEVQKFIDQAAWGGSAGTGDVAGILTGAYTFMNKDLAAYYGVAGPTGATWQKVDLNPASRPGGVLTQGGLMALMGKPNQTALPQRGKFVREQFLCAPPPPPPQPLPPAAAAPPVPGATDTQRERWAKLTAPATCNACHSLINPLGFGLENIDTAGQWRVKDGTFPVDASGEFIGTDIDGAFTGTADMAQKLAGSAQVRGCVATQWFRFAAGREESDADTCGLARLKQAFENGKGNIRELLVGLTQTDAFLYRAVEGG